MRRRPGIPWATAIQVRPVSSRKLRSKEIRRIPFLIYVGVSSIALSYDDDA